MPKNVALQTRNVLKRLFAYAIAREKAKFNPAAAIDAKFIATAKSRDVALTAEEIGKLLRAIYQSSIKRSQKLALHLLIICMVRKSELIEATWDEIDFDQSLWIIPVERMKKDKAHIVPLDHYNNPTLRSDTFKPNESVMSSNSRTRTDCQLHRPETA